MATWNKVNTARKLWTTRGRISPNLEDCPADLQSFVGEAIHVAANVTSQLQSLSSFNVGAYEPGVNGPIGHSLMVADRLGLFRLAVIAILSVGLTPAVADDLPCLARVNAFGDAFTMAVVGLRVHTFSNYSMPSVPDARPVLCDMVSRDNVLRVSELMPAAQRSTPASWYGVRPPTHARVRTHSQGLPQWWKVFRLVLSIIGRPIKWKATVPLAGWPVSKGKANSSLPPGLPDVRAHR